MHRPEDRHRFSARLGIDVDVDPLAEQDRMRLVTDHPPLGEHASVGRGTQPPRRIGLELPGHPLEELVALRRVAHQL